MNRRHKEDTIYKKKKAGGLGHQPFELLKQKIRKHINVIWIFVMLTIFIVAVIMVTIEIKKAKEYEANIQEQQEWLLGLKENIPQEDVSQQDETVSDILPEYQKIYEENPDVIGWLKIEDTNIDYPVMQTMEDEEYYIYRDFYGNENKHGTLFMDTDSIAGEGTLENQYSKGNAPSTNLIIYGHTVKTGQMFGNLSLYEDETYGMEHNIICFDTIYEKRKYELISVFYSEIFYKHQDVFKYYKFFQADTQEEFDDWYNNIKAMSLYDTGVTAEFGDEFITLSCCAYHVEDGRFVVVGRRIKEEME